MYHQKDISQKGTVPGHVPALQTGECLVGVSGHRNTQRCMGSGGAHRQRSPPGQHHRVPLVPSFGSPVAPGTASPAGSFCPRDEVMKTVVQASDSKNHPWPGKAQQGICLSGAALPRRIPKEPRQGQVCFPTVFAAAEPPVHPQSPLRAPASPAVPAQALSLASPPPAARRPSATSVW